MTKSAANAGESGNSRMRPARDVGMRPWGAAAEMRTYGTVVIAR